MCRIDAPFNNINLDEKADPKERLAQALDEFGIDGEFRNLFNNHFEDCWKSQFHGVTGLEKLLAKVSQEPSEQGKCIAILQDSKFVLKHSFYAVNPYVECPKPRIFGFLKDVKDKYFSGSPYAFYSYSRVMEEVFHNYYNFTAFVYDDDFHLSKEFFDDPVLNQLGRECRERLLWKCFYSIAPEFKSSLSKVLHCLASQEVLAGPPTQSTHKILKGFDFLKAWIKFDSIEGRLGFDLSDFLYSVDGPFDSLEELDANVPANNESLFADNEDLRILVQDWWGKQKLELQQLMITNADPSLMSDDDKRSWVEGVEHCLFSVNSIQLDNNKSRLSNEQYNCRLYAMLNCFGESLTKTQFSEWITFSFEEDFNEIIDPLKKPTGLTNRTTRWLKSDFIELWKSLFVRAYKKLSLRDRLTVLTGSYPYRQCNNVDSRKSIKCFWQGLYRELVVSEGFPKKLVPIWSVSAMDCLEREEIIPFVDKSIGILRGELSTLSKPQEESAVHNQLEQLLSFFERSSPKKALRHRLLLMRATQTPFSDESLNTMESSFEKEGCKKWFKTLIQELDEQFINQSNPFAQLLDKDTQQSKRDFYLEFSAQMAEFCLDRLKLRKGEELRGDTYDNHQVIEQSPIWRQGYLKALTELGLDLKGKVHRTVNLTKKSDPESDIRSIASECYKAARRHTKKNPSLDELRRGLIAAEWWLLLCQRQELNLGVDHQEALKTRRRLMRNPR